MTNTILHICAALSIYWLANILPEAPRGNLPRHPLVFAEIEEETVSVRKDSIVVVDERQEGEPDAVQLSNFSVLEDRETLDIEIYLTRLHENPDNIWDANTYCYRFSPPA